MPVLCICRDGQSFKKGRLQMRRKDCFFGLHFDFHANKHSAAIGSEWKDEILEELLVTVKPDYVQCDTKGHAGYSSYPTKVGTPAPLIHTDILRQWRRITKKHHVLLYGHHSGLWDTVASEKHPEWAAVDHEGNKTDKMSVFGGYADGLLIPQLVELAVDYELDGAWVDGECWAAQIDYSDAARDAYRKATGKEAPLPDDEEFEKYKDFCRQGFFDYVQHYIAEVKKVAPHFELTRN